MGNLPRSVLIHQTHLCRDRQTDVFCSLGIPGDRSIFVAQIAHHKRQRVVMNTDRKFQVLRYLTFQLCHDGDRACRNLTHIIVIKVGIIGRASHTILNIVNASKEYRTILYLHITTVTNSIDTIMTGCTFHILLIFEKKQVLTLMSEDSSGDAVLLDSCFIDRP